MKEIITTGKTVDLAIEKKVKYTVILLTAEFSSRG